MFSVQIEFSCSTANTIQTNEAARYFLKTCFGSDFEPAKCPREEVVTVVKHGKGLEWQAVAAKQISVPNYCCQGSAARVYWLERIFH